MWGRGGGHGEGAAGWAGLAHTSGTSHWPVVLWLLVLMTDSNEMKKKYVDVMMQQQVDEGV